MKQSLQSVGSSIFLQVCLYLRLFWTNIYIGYTTCAGPLCLCLSFISQCNRILDTGHRLLFVVESRKLTVSARKSFLTFEGLNYTTKFEETIGVK